MCLDGDSSTDCFDSAHTVLADNEKFVISIQTEKEEKNRSEIFMLTTIPFSIESDIRDDVYNVVTLTFYVWPQRAGTSTYAQRASTCQNSELRSHLLLLLLFLGFISFIRLSHAECRHAVIHFFVVFCFRLPVRKSVETTDFFQRNDRCLV